MACEIRVLFTPAEFRALRGQNLSQTCCVVFDVLRATSTMVTALANGASAVIPVEEISEALEVRRKRPGVLLAGERDGLRIGAALSGGVEFDLGNSPREFSRERVTGQTIVTTTTNGTRALRACLGAHKVLVSSFLNLSASARAIRNSTPKRLLLVCAGTGEETALEDVLAVGALCESLSDTHGTFAAEDSALIAREIYQAARGDLLAAVSRSRNAQRLLAHPDLRDDVRFCLRQDEFDLAPEMGTDATVRRT